MATAPGSGAAVWAAVWMPETERLVADTAAGVTARTVATGAAETCTAGCGALLAGMGTGIGAATGAAATSFELRGTDGATKPALLDRGTSALLVPLVAATETAAPADCVAGLLITIGTAGFDIDGIAMRGPASLPPGKAIDGAAVAAATAPEEDPASDCAITSLPFCVPSAPQTGQLTGPGSLPLSGSTSNLYLLPQLQ